MINKIKTKLFEILSTKYKDYQVIDNAAQRQETFPCLQLRLSTVTRDRYNKNYQYVVRYQVHIFSDYEGQQQLLDMESEIFDMLEEFYTIDGIVYVNENFRILDDKSMGVMRKHGIISLSFYCNGMEQEVEDESNETSP